MNVRGLIVGFGFIAQGHLVGYAASPGADVAGVFDISGARRELAAAQGLPAFDDLHEAIDRVAPDFLDICTPPSSHEGYMWQAMDHGIDALCEKPLFTTGGDGEQRLFERSVAGPSFVFPVHNYRYAPIFSRLSAVTSRTVLHPRFGSIQIYRDGHAHGVSEWRPDWRREPAFSLGGIVMDHGPHAIYVAEMLNRSHITAVAALLHEEVRHPGSESAADLRLRFASGAEMQVMLTWKGRARESHYRVVYEQGFVAVHDDDLTVHLPSTKLSETVLSSFNDATHGRWFAGVLEEFVAARDDTDLRTSRLQEAQRICRCICAAYRSAGDAGSWQPV